MSWHTYLWDEVSKSDCGHGNEDKIEGLEEPPVLPGPVYDGSHEDVDEQYDDRNGDGEVEFVINFEGAEGGGSRRFVPVYRQVGLLLYDRVERHLQLDVLSARDGGGPSRLTHHLTWAAKSSEVVYELHALHDFLQQVA